MRALATPKKLSSLPVPAPAALERGRVERVAPGGVLFVQLGGVLRETRRAKSCLVAPEPGDTVLCAADSTPIYVLAVLEGAEGAPTKIAPEGEVQILSRGAIDITAAGTVNVLGARGVRVAGDELALSARKGSAAIEDLGFVGRVLRADVKKVALIAKELDEVVERFSQRAKRVFRFVSEIDQTRAGTVDMRAQNLAAIRGENTVVSARVLAKIDGEQIHLG